MSRSCPPRLQLDSKMGVKDICSKVFETWCVFVAVRVLGVCSSQHCTVCLKFTKPVDLMCSHHVKKKKITVRQWMLGSLTVVISPLCIHISKHQVVYLKLYNFYLLIIPQ